MGQKREREKKKDTKGGIKERTINDKDESNLHKENRAYSEFFRIIARIIPSN